MSDSEEKNSDLPTVDAVATDDKDQDDGANLPIVNSIVSENNEQDSAINLATTNLAATTEVQEKIDGTNLSTTELIATASVEQEDDTQLKGVNLSVTSTRIEQTSTAELPNAVDLKSSSSKEENPATDLLTTNVNASASKEDATAIELPSDNLDAASVKELPTTSTEFVVAASSDDNGQSSPAINLLAENGIVPDEKIETSASMSPASIVNSSDAVEGEEKTAEVPEEDPLDDVMEHGTSTETTVKLISKEGKIYHIERETAILAPTLDVLLTDLSDFGGKRPDAVNLDKIPSKHLAVICGYLKHKEDNLKVVNPPDYEFGEATLALLESAFYLNC